jgi:uncharacterized protein YndB with AHSA1/START domain
MPQLEFTAEIAAPPNEVFAFFVPQRMAYWYDAEMQSSFEVAGGAAEFAAGQKVRISGRLGKREVALTVVITRYEWGRLLEWRFQDAYGVRGLQRWEIEPVGASPGLARGTHVRLREEYELPGWVGRMVDWLVTRRAVARRDRDSLARLARLAERR